MPIMNTVIQGGGTTPTGTKSITSNGVYDVTDFASADVQVPTTAPAYYKEYTVDNGVLKVAPDIIKLNGATDISAYALIYAYYQVRFPNNTVIDLSSLTTISGQQACQYMFQQAFDVISVDLSNLVTVSGYAACQFMFSNCQSLQTADLSSLTTISSSNNGCQSMFNACANLTTVDLSSLTTISGASGCENMFSGCSSLTSINLNSLTTVSASGVFNSFARNCISLTSAKFNALNSISHPFASNAVNAVFNGCTYLESVEFGGLTASTFASAVNQIQYLFGTTTGSQATNGCTVHFPSNFDPSDPNHTFDASTLTGYPTFGGSASYIHVAFDLPATE